MCKRVSGLRLSLREGLWEADRPHQCFPVQLVAWVMHWAAGGVTWSERGGTYSWVDHSRIQVGKQECDLSNLTQVIQGQEKNPNPMTWTIAGSTKCKFPHPTDRFKFAFDGNTHSSNFLFVSICYPQAAVLEGRQKGCKHHQFKICF